MLGSLQSHSFSGCPWVDLNSSWLLQIFVILYFLCLSLLFPSLLFLCVSVAYMRLVLTPLMRCVAYFRGCFLLLYFVCVCCCFFFCFWAWALHRSRSITGSLVSRTGIFGLATFWQLKHTRHTSSPLSSSSGCGHSSMQQSETLKVCKSLLRTACKSCE